MIQPSSLVTPACASRLNVSERLKRVTWFHTQLVLRVSARSNPKLLLMRGSAVFVADFAVQLTKPLPTICLFFDHARNIHILYSNTPIRMKKNQLFPFSPPGNIFCQHASLSFERNTFILFVDFFLVIFNEYFLLCLSNVI